jgi:hypothetical protein
LGKQEKLTITSKPVHTGAVVEPNQKINIGTGYGTQVCAGGDLDQ